DQEKDYNAQKYTPTGNLDEVQGLASDHSTFDQVEQDLHGPGGLNWESWTFAALRSEMDALQAALPQIEAHKEAWKGHGNTLKTESEAFKKSVRGVLSGKWSGASADAADAATQQVTKTSIFDFTPSSDALADRLTALSQAFAKIIG